MVYDSTPKPRQKSCQGCKSAKRRCDLAFPACSRCVQRKITCVYHGQPPPASMNWASETPPPIDLLQDAWQPLATTPQCQTEYNIIAPQFPLDIFQDIRESHVNAPDKSAQYSWLSQSHEEESSFDFELAVMRTRTRPPRLFSEVLVSRLQFSIDAFKDAPRMMLLENQTPWCHSHLYKHSMPKSMQDAYACCSLYLSKNEINAPVIMNLLDKNITDLLSTPQPTTLPDLLARVHALLLYQIMCLFDGDVRFRRTVDMLFLALETSVLSLLPLLKFPLPSDSIEPLPDSMEPMSEFWKCWILEESARRTVFISFFFSRIYEALRETPNMACDGKLGLDHSWYLSSYLWHAQNAFDFAVAWAERPHFVVENLDFSWALKAAQPADVDLFGKMLLVTLVGIDDARAWFYSRGALL